MRLGRDGIAGLIGLAVSLALLPIAYGLPKLPIVPVGPGFYPILVLVFLGVTSLILLLQDAMGLRRAARSAPAEATVSPPRAYGLVVAAFALIALYIALLPQVGFRIATVLFVAAFQLMLERPRSPWQWARVALIALVAVAVTYIVFDQYLSVLLPRGRWTDW